MAAHRYWRINVLTAAASGGVGGINIQEIEMATSVAGTDECAGGTATSQTPVVSGRDASRAFDNSAGSSNFWALNAAPPGWIQYDFGLGNDKDIKEIRIAAQSAARCPLTWEVLYSDDNATFTLVQTYSKLTSWSPYSLNFFSFPLPTAVITSITPPNGAIGGGTSVVVAGSGFTGATGITFDGTPGTSFVVVDDVTITCDTPAHALATVDTVVQHPFGDSLPFNFTYGGSDVETHITQLPMLVAYLPVQAARVTQLPLLVANLPTPVPLPTPIVPEVGLKEVWAWKSVVNISKRGKEQRSALRASPRYRLSFDALVLNEAERRATYQLLFSYINKVFPYPFYQYSTAVTGPSSEGSAFLYCDTTKSDFRVGELAAVFDPSENYLPNHLGYATISNVNGDSLSVDPLDFATHIGMLVCPVVNMRMTGEAALMMRAIAGNTSVILESVQSRVFQNPGASYELTFKDDILVIAERHIANSDIGETFNMNVDWLDNSIAPPVPYTNWRQPFVAGTRSFHLRRPGDIDHWRAVADTLKGQTNPFLIPTFRDDFPLVELPAPGANVLVTTNIQYFTFWRSKAYRYIRVQDTSGGVNYHRIQNASMNYDVDGNPYSVNLLLDAAISDTNIVRISFMYLCRMGSDEITIVHEEESSILTLPIRAINE